MAIRRCPYCKAIIDEGLEYCSNCGTQLIFPEDEFVDEEIPGEKIVDVTEEESELEEEAGAEESKDLTSAAEDIETEKTGEMAGGEIKAETSEMTETENLAVEASDVPAEEDVGPDELEDVILETEEAIEETGELEAKPEIKMESEEFVEEAEEHETVEEEISPKEEIELTEHEEFKEEESQEEGVPIKQPSDDSRKYTTGNIPDSEEIVQVEDVFAGVEEETGEIRAEGESKDFKTEDLERILDPAEKEKEEIEKFLSSLKEEREKTKKYYEETGELPPWAQSMKEASISSITSEEEIEKPEETLSPDEDKFIDDIKPLEEESSPVEDVSVSADTGMGLPEGIDQKGLPFSQDFHEEEGEESGPHFRYRNMNFPSWIKSRVFDVLMIAGIWLITVWLASIVAGASFFRLVTVSTLPILVFLAILLTVYFFLFFFFLGETLGDQIFSQEE